MKKSLLLSIALALALIAFPSLASADMEPVFGPVQYTRTTGKPQTFTDTFSSNGTQECQIIVVNGSEDGKNRLSSATISLNDTKVVRPNDFNQQVSQIVKPVVLSDDNQIVTKLTSNPAGYITVEVDCNATSGMDDNGSSEGDDNASVVAFSLGGAGVSVPEPGTLLSAVPVINDGGADAQNVQVTAIAISGGTLTSPVSLPFNLGTIASEGSIILNADFSGGPFEPGNNPYLLSVNGTYELDGATNTFQLSVNLVVPPVAPGSATLGSVDIPVGGSVTGAPYPHQDRSFDENDNPAFWSVPTAPFVPGTPTAEATAVLPAPFGDPPAIVFNANSGMELVSGPYTGQAGTTAEPSGGVTADGVIFSTANWTAAFSTDGVHFTQLDPTTIFPNDAVGFCCDQIVQYVPSINRFVWFLQGNGYRLAMASPQDIINSGGTAWTYWDLTPDAFGSCTGLDYPDLSVGNNYLYMSWDAGGNCTGGLQVARTSLSGIQAGGTITVEFTNPADSPMAWGGHLTQDTGDAVFWAGHNDNSSLRVFSCAEGSNQYSWRNVGISSWANNAPTSMTPDGQDWLAKNFHGPKGNSFPRNGVIGATRSGDEIWFGWTAGTDDNFPQAHVEMVQLALSNDFHKDQQVQIWNPDYAFAYPSLATNACTGEVGLSFEYGGNSTDYENHVVGFWGDYVAYRTTGSEVGTSRFGDYVTIRQAPSTAENPGNLFAAFGYGLNLASDNSTTTDVHYVLFGRPASSCVVIQ